MHKSNSTGKEGQERIRASSDEQIERDKRERYIGGIEKRITYGIDPL